MIQVGILSEKFHNDTQALKVLLEKKFDGQKVAFLPIIKNLEGGQLDNIVKLNRLLSVTVKEEELDLVICMRDLDRLPSETRKIEERQAWFQKVKTIKPKIFFLVIRHLEALILADIETFNTEYKVRISYSGNPLWEGNPKNFLREKTEKSPKQYRENQALDIFKKLDFDKVYARHVGPISFKSFIDELHAIINPTPTP